MRKLSRSLLAVGALMAFAACGDDVSVVQPPPPAVAVTGAPSAALRVGDQVQLSANQPVSWQSSAASVASVDANGLVTANAAGTASITATSNADATNKASVTIQVSASKGIVSVEVQPQASILAPGQTLQLAANVVADAGVARTVTWASSNQAVATVSPTGVVTAVAPGTATITATSTVDPAISGNMALTVRQPTAANISIKSVTTGVTNVPVNVNNVFGQIDVTVNVDPGDFVLQKVELMVDGNVCTGCTQTFSAAQSQALRLAAAGMGDEAAAQSEIVFSINTAEFNGSNGNPTYDNGSHTISAKLTTTDGTSGGSANPSVVLLFNNASGVVLTLTNDNGADPASAVNSGTGISWIGGSPTLKAVAVSYVANSDFQSVTVNLFGSVQVISLTNNVGQVTYTEGSTFNGTNARVGNYTSLAPETPVIAASVLGNAAGPAGASALLNGTNGIPAWTPVSLDNSAPGVPSANGVAQTPNTTATVVIWVNASSSFSAGNLGIPTQSTLNASDVGVSNVIAEVWVTAAGAALPSGCSTTGLTKVATGADLAETTVSSTYRARVIYKDGLGNISCSSLSGGTQFGADFTAPTGTITGPAANTGYNAGLPGWAVAASDNASGFSATPLVVIMSRLNANGTTTCVIGTSNCTVGAARGLAFAGDDGTGTDGYYTTTINLVDQAGNSTSLVASRLYLQDVVAPGFSGGISLPALIAGAQTNTFVATATDNLDVGSIFGDVTYATGVLRYPTQSLGTFGPALETSMGVSYAAANWIRCLNTNAAGFAAAANQPSGITLTLVDQTTLPATNPTSLASPAFGANAQTCTGDVGNIGAANINSFGADAANYGAGKTAVDVSGTNMAATSSATVTVTAVADVALNTSADPFSRVDFYYQLAGGQWVKAGTATATLAQTQTNRTYTYTFVFDPDANVPTGAAVPVVFIGVDAQGDAIFSASQTLNIVP